MRILSRSDFPTTGQYLAYQRDTYTNVTGRDLQLEAGRTELPIGAVLVCVFLLSGLKTMRDWLLPRIHGEVQGVPVRTIRGVAVPAARLVRVPVVVDAETVLTTSRLAFSDVLRRDRELRERF